jgi:hypothetical protein
MAMPVVKVKARTIATNIFFIDDLPLFSGITKRHHAEHSDVVLKGEYLLLGLSFHSGAANDQRMSNLQSPSAGAST